MGRDVSEVGWCGSEKELDRRALEMFLEVLGWKVCRW